jgi:hypothetical protein
MQEPTHILAGVVIQRSLQPIRPRWLGLTLTAVCAFLSHGVLDHLANSTYHPPEAKFDDPFWIAFHLSVLVCTLVFLFVWWRKYKVGILFAMLPDLDWVFIHGQRIFGINPPFYKHAYMHNCLHVIIDTTWPFKYIVMPNNRQNPWACLWEVALILTMLLVIRLLTRKPARSPATPAPASRSPRTPPQP